MFFDNFERMCKRAHTTPSGAAIAAGLNKNRPSNWKQSGTLPKQDELAKLAKVLHCDVGDFFYEHTRYPTPHDALLARANAEAALEADLDDNEKELLRIYRALDKKDRALFMVSAYSFEEEHL